MTTTTARQRAAAEANRLRGQLHLTMRAALAAGEDLDQDVTAALLEVDRWCRRLAGEQATTAA